MLRITLVSSGPAEVVLKVEGAIAGQEVALLEQEGRPWLGQTSLRLDLDGVQFIDEEGLELLERWHHQGALLRGGSLFVKTLLQRRGLVREPGLFPN
ncbi:MAG: hypothetical protein HYW07_07780 [Candidatus Latescibacteria bacterium]|nr:hypothetical protein [Candidatus Latescibacterota bacterium]